MAPPVGTLRVGRYFLALLALFAVLYSVVAFGSRHTPKLGLDLVGGVRVIFTAQTPKGSPPPTSDQMTQARQIIEDRINGTGVTGSTVLVQGSDQLVVEIPGGTGTDVEKLGTAAILNFRGVAGPAQAVSCVPKGTKLPTTSSSASPSGGSTASPSTSPTGASSTGPTTSGAAATSAASHAPDAASERPLAAAPSTGTSTSASTATSSSGSASTSTSGSASTSTSGSAATSPAAPSSSAATAPAATRCLADPFTNRKSSAAVRALPAQLAKLYKVTTKNPLIQNVLPNAETCPSPGISATDCRAYSSLSTAQTQTIAVGLQSLDCNSTQTEPDLNTGAYYACDDGTLLGTKAAPVKVAYLLGHVVVAGKNIDSATAQAPNITNGQTQWTVALTLTSSGGDKWNAWTSKYNTTDSSASAVQTSTTVPCGPSATTPCSDFVGFTLDGVVITAPVTQAALDINTSISGNFDSGSANALAQQLNYGKLPVSFRPDAVEKVSATLGTQQLHAALLAGGIGLLLVVIYSMLYYRALGLVTIASLLVSAGLTYGFLVLLGTQIGFTLDLAGIAGFIVALGITADSFVVFFERLKDEVHEGRSVRVAVPRAWVRARRTILSADTVSFLAAAILYYFASADVKGFAFTLGMSTILDLVVVFLFTHPIVSILSRSKTFGSARITGLDSVRGRTPVDDSPAAIARSSSGDAAATKRTAAPVAVAERDDPDAEETEAFEADEPAGSVDDADADDARERRRTEPEAGSAAERAAARRARMRENRGDKSRGDGETN